MAYQAQRVSRTSPKLVSFYTGRTDILAFRVPLDQCQETVGLPPPVLTHD
jgi:hypothetical protein